MHGELSHHPGRCRRQLTHPGAAFLPSNGPATPRSGATDEGSAGGCSPSHERPFLPGLATVSVCNGLQKLGFELRGYFEGFVCLTDKEGHPCALGQGFSFYDDLSIHDSTGGELHESIIHRVSSYHVLLQHSGSSSSTSDFIPRRGAPFSYGTPFFLYGAASPPLGGAIFLYERREFLYGGGSAPRGEGVRSCGATGKLRGGVEKL